MIIDGKGSIFDSGADAIVIPVNCVGVAGKGLALEAKKRWRTWFASYQRVCASVPHFAGDVWYHETPDNWPRWILSAATKQHWRNNSTEFAVGTALGKVRAWVVREQPDAIAIPALGCGLGGLKWTDVRPMIERCFDPAYSGVTIRSKVIVFEPQ